MKSSYSAHVINAISGAEDPVRAVTMKKYMKNKFEYYGVASPQLHQATKPFLLKQNLPTVSEIPKLTLEFWNHREREAQYFAIELLKKYVTRSPENWIEFYEELIVTKSWWDTVDALAAWQVGYHFKNHPDQIAPFTSKWMDSGNMWLQRTCLIFQLKYKEKTDFELMRSFIRPLAGSKEFFIQKAIGWALREYSKVFPQKAMEFVSTQSLAKLSYREATRIVLKK